MLDRQKSCTWDKKPGTSLRKLSCHSCHHAILSLLLPSSHFSVTTPERSKKRCFWEAIGGPDAEAAEKKAQESVFHPTLSQSELHAYVITNMDCLLNTSVAREPQLWNCFYPIGL